MTPITDIATLESLYGPASPRSLTKVAGRLTPAYRRWIGASRFCVLSTVGPDGTDGSPRGDDGPVAETPDDRTLLIPDWQGNNRLDSLRNIVSDGRISVMFMVPGSESVVRVNGTAILTADADLRAAFDRDGRQPRTVIAVTVTEVYFQCAKALMRSGLWSRGDDSAGLPTAGDFLREQDESFDAADHDAGYPTYARDRLW